MGEEGGRGKGREEALKWFASYLKNRTFLLRLVDFSRKRGFLQFGVPQGGFLGSVLLTMYTQPLIIIILMYSQRCASLSKRKLKFIPAKKILMLSGGFFRVRNTNDKIKIFWRSCLFQLWPPDLEFTSKKNAVY